MRRDDRRATGADDAATLLGWPEPPGPRRTRAAGADCGGAGCPNCGCPLRLLAMRRPIRLLADPLRRQAPGSSAVPPAIRVAVAASPANVCGGAIDGGGGGGACSDWPGACGWHRSPAVEAACGRLLVGNRNHGGEAPCGGWFGSGYGCDILNSFQMGCVCDQPPPQVPVGRRPPGRGESDRAPAFERKAEREFFVSPVGAPMGIGVRVIRSAGNRPVTTVVRARAITFTQPLHTMLQARHIARGWLAHASSAAVRRHGHASSG